MIKLHDAILKLMPSAEVTVINENEIIWGENCLNNHPSEKAIQAKLKELQAEYDALQYQRDRAEQYPSITDVVVALAEKQEGDDTMWQEITAKRAKVKSDNPKPK